MDINNIFEFKDKQTLISRIKQQLLYVPFKKLTKSGYVLIKPYITKEQIQLKTIIIKLKNKEQQQSIVNEIIKYNIQLFEQYKKVNRQLDEKFPLFEKFNSKSSSSQNNKIVESNINTQVESNSNKINNIQEFKINNGKQISNSDNSEINPIVSEYINNIFKQTLTKTRNQFNISDFMKYVLQVQNYIKNYKQIKASGLKKTQQLLNKQIANLIKQINRKTFIRLTDIQSQAIANKLAIYLFNESNI